MRFSLVLLAAFALISLQTVCSQTSTISSTEWAYQQIGNSLVDRENRIKALIAEIQPKVDSYITEFASNALLNRVSTALNKLKTRLTDYNTVSSYGSMNATLGCNEVVAKISNFKFDLAKCATIKYANDVNATLLYVDAVSLNVAYVANYFSLTDAQRQNIQSLVTSLTVLVNEYNQHSVTLVMAVYKYTQLYIEQLSNKKAYCSCPTTLSSAAASALATVDSNLKQIQTNVDTRETSIRTKATDLVNKIAAINPDLKQTAAYIFITTTLDSITTLVKGYQQLTTTCAINSTVNCDDASSKIALLQYKFDLYFQMNAEAARNTSFVLYYHNNLYAYYARSYYQLSDTQRTGITDVIAAMKSLVDEYVQLILTFSVSLNKLKVELMNAKTARAGSCSCTDTAGGTTLLTTSGTTLTTSELQKLQNC
jgi:hypothetical protein